ncbi:hypothetical protein UCREL1_11774 [Eutypa lata UCREL1]|uniref:Secreted protein n=1 Tax=Eutypa lata (strain UCR-EL1) TaxID=1287681 RepID=M7S5F0_EUTLA|nr:hypothetical protein UCREL1_11774 [Eutypa lata UCREL1]
MRLYMVLIALAFIIAVFGSDATQVNEVSEVNEDAIVNILGQQGYKIAPFTLQGSLKTGGDVVSFNGTLQEIDAQARRIKRDFTWEDFHSEKPTEADTIQPRWRPVENKTLCHVQHLKSGPKSALEAAQMWLMNYSFWFQVSAQTCERVWCELGGDLWLCNDNLGWSEFYSVEMKNLTDSILSNEDCADRDDPNKMQGQVFQLERNYNVLFNGNDGLCS